MGSGGVGASFAPIAARRDFYEHIVFADYDLARAERVVERYDGGTGRFSAIRVDASDAAQVAEVIRANGVTHVLNGQSLPLLGVGIVIGVHMVLH